MTLFFLSFFLSVSVSPGLEGIIISKASRRSLRRRRRLRLKSRTMHRRCGGGRDGGGIERCERPRPARWQLSLYLLQATTTMAAAATEGAAGGRTPDGSNNSNLRRAGTGQEESSRMERGSLLYQRKRETAKLLCVCHEAVSSSLMLRDVVVSSSLFPPSLVHLCHVPCNCAQCLSFTFPLSSLDFIHAFISWETVAGRRLVVECGRPRMSMYDNCTCFVH